MSVSRAGSSIAPAAPPDHRPQAPPPCQGPVQPLPVAPHDEGYFRVDSARRITRPAAQRESAERAYAPLPTETQGVCRGDVLPPEVVPAEGVPQAPGGPR